MEYGLLIIFFVLAIAFSFLCSILEAVLLSVTPSYVRIREQEGSSIAKDLRHFKEDIDRPLSAILTLNTLAHTVGAIGVGAEAGKLFGSQMISIAGREVISWEALIASVMTLAVLILSEIIPKTLGANNWKALTPVSVRILKVMIIMLWPLIWISQFITRSMKKEKGRSVLSRSDFQAMAEVVEKEGEIEEEEGRIIRNLLKFNEITAHQVMTPRTVLLASEENVTIREFYDSHEQMRFSRIPVFPGKIDNIDGYILKDDLLDAVIKGQGDQPLSSLKRKIEIIPENRPIPDILEDMVESNEHIALVVDEYGGVEGIVTQEDILETLLGLEIMDELDNYADMRDLAQRKWKHKSKELGLK